MLDGLIVSVDNALASEDLCWNGKQNDERNNQKDPEEETRTEQVVISDDLYYGDTSSMKNKRSARYVSTERQSGDAQLDS